jgi:hypothetical protein
MKKETDGGKVQEINSFLESLDDDSLWEAYSEVVGNLKKRNLIRSKNITGDRGEDIVVKFYNSTPNEPKLQLAPEGTQNVDAISRKGERYSIKTIGYPNTTTGVFYGLNPPEIKSDENKKFEYLVVVVIDESFRPLQIFECSWDVFLKYKKWHKTMKAWNISLTKEFKKECRVIFGGNNEQKIN